MLAAMRQTVTDLGFTSLVAPVRPSAKHEHPGLPIGEYAALCRDDGLPAGPWLRVHIRAGGRVPVHCDAAHDHAVYREPCVWFHHRLT